MVVSPPESRGVAIKDRADDAFDSVRVVGVTPILA